MELNFNRLLLDAGSVQMEFKKYDIIYSEKQKLQGVYYLKAGKVRIDTSTKQKNAQVLMWLLVDENFFGITSFFENDKIYQYRATVVSDTASVLFISSETFTYLISKNGAFRDYMFKLLNRRLDFINLRKSYSSRNSLRKKVADTLVYFDNILAADPNSERIKRREISLTLSELSEMNNTSKKQMGVVIDDFVSKKIIERTADKIWIKNYNKIIQIQ